jgi:hypothetical protein
VRKMALVDGARVAGQRILHPGHRPAEELGIDSESLRPHCDLPTIRLSRVGRACRRTVGVASTELKLPVPKRQEEYWPARPGSNTATHSANLEVEH